MKTYYERNQVKTSNRVAQGALVAVLVGLALACLQTLAHEDSPQDLAGLTQEQRVEIMGRQQP